MLFKRFIAYCIDSFICLILSGIVLVPRLVYIFTAKNNTNFLNILGCIYGNKLMTLCCFTISCVIYSLACSRTLGKMLMDIKIVYNTDISINYIKVLREVVKILLIPFYLVVLIMMLLGKSHNFFWDILCRTEVMENN